MYSFFQVPINNSIEFLVLSYLAHILCCRMPMAICFFWKFSAIKSLRISPRISNEWFKEALEAITIDIIFDSAGFAVIVFLECHLRTEMQLGPQRPSQIENLTFGATMFQKQNAFIRLIQLKKNALKMLPGYSWATIWQYYYYY